MPESMGYTPVEDQEINTSTAKREKAAKIFVDLFQADDDMSSAEEFLYAKVLAFR